MNAPNDDHPKAKRRPSGCVLLILWTVALAILGVIGGLTGSVKMEYTGAKPWEHAIMLAWSFGCYGLISGILFILALKFYSMLRRMVQGQGKSGKPPTS